MVNYLLDSKKVDINERDKNGQTPLINACLLGDNMAATRRKLIRLFLSKNADVNIADNSGRNVLMWACDLGKIDVVKILFGRSLMDLDFTCVDRDGNTALHYVSSMGHYTLTCMLVEGMKRFGISLDRRNRDGMTPLLAATKSGKELCAGVLLENGASPDIVDPRTCMNVKELAEKRNFASLVDQITIRNPTTQSRCTFPRQPDDDDMRSAMHASDREDSSTPTAQEKAPANQEMVRNTSIASENRTPLLSRRKVKVENSTKDFENLTLTAYFSECSSPRDSECNSVPPIVRQSKSAYPRIELKSGNNPYDLRDLKQVLSLYGEQQSATFRKGFSTPIMTREEFEQHLETMKPKAPSSYSRRPSQSRSSTSSVGLSPLFQQRRHSVLLKEHNLRRSSDPSHNNRRNSVAVAYNPRDGSSTCKGAKEKRLVRNLSDPLLDERLTVKTSNLRRHSLMVTAQLHY